MGKTRRKVNSMITEKDFLEFAKAYYGDSVVSLKNDSYTRDLSEFLERMKEPIDELAKFTMPIMEEWRPEITGNKLA